MGKQMTDATLNEVAEMKRIILRLCRERARDFHPLDAGKIALDELESEGYIDKSHGVYILTPKGSRL